MNRDVPLLSRLSHVANVERAEIMKRMFGCTSRRWEGIYESNPTTTLFEDWVQEILETEDLDVNKPKDFDKLLLCMKPSQRAICYCRMKAFGNHFRVEDAASTRMQTYDSGVSLLFTVPTTDARDVSVNYIGVVKDIFKLNYGPLSSPIVLLTCQWAKQRDNWRNPTYTRDDAGFLVVNVWHNLPRLSDPFIFASQTTQVFYSDVPNKPGWKVILRKEARARREILEHADVFMTTLVDSSSLTTPDQIPPLPNMASLVGAIQLSVQDQRWQWHRTRL
jgi:hypothetical protein